MNPWLRRLLLSIPTELETRVRVLSYQKPHTMHVATSTSPSTADTVCGLVDLDVRVFFTGQIPEGLHVEATCQECRDG